MSTVYQIRDWDLNFENYKSRERDQLTFISMPNKQHGMGFTRLMAEPDGMAIYGVWCALVGACSQQTRRPRNGWLTDTGTPDGCTWTAADIALKYRRQEAEITRAMEVLSSPRIGWLVAHDGHHQDTPQTRDGCAAGTQRVLDGCAAGALGAISTPLSKGSKGSKVIEVREENTDSLPAVATSSPAVSPAQAEVDEQAATFPDFPTKGGKSSSSRTWRLTEAHTAELAKTFPTVNVAEQCRRAWQWASDNPTKRKTATGMKAFLSRWMTTASTTAKATPPPSDDGSTGFVRAPMTQEMLIFLHGEEAYDRYYAAEYGPRTVGGEA